MSATNVLRSLIDHVEKTWSANDQEELAAIVHAMDERRKGIYVMTPEEEEAVAEGLGQADRGEFVDDATRQAALRRYGL